MPRLTAEERAQLEALNKRAQEEDDADKGFMVRARNAKGIEVEYTGQAARDFLTRHGFEEAEAAEQEDSGEGGEGGSDPAPAESGGYFRGRRAPKAE